MRTDSGSRHLNFVILSSKHVNYGFKKIVIIVHLFELNCSNAQYENKAFLFAFLKDSAGAE